ncbi:MAG: hypothetical protein U9N58_07570 [Thermodesulfobacteriota bacterium]|nr:hypothetical protein [Thermodesulfobacteriota bacterium]
MRRKDIRIVLLLGFVLLIASPVALATDVPRDGATTVTPDAGYGSEDASGRASVTRDLNSDGRVAWADAPVAPQMAARGKYSKDADVNGNSMITSPDALSILQTTSAGCRIVVDEYTADVADTIRIPIRVEGGVDVVRDNKVNMFDYLYIARYTVGLEPAPGELVAGTIPADSHNGINMLDALYIARHTVNLESAP